MSEAIVDAVKAVPSREEVQEHFRAWLESARDAIPETVGSVEPVADMILAIVWGRPYHGQLAGYYGASGVDLLAGRPIAGTLKYDDPQTLDEFDPRSRCEVPATLLRDELPPDRTCEEIARDDGANVDARVDALRELMGRDLRAASAFIAEALCRPGLANGWRDALVFAAENAFFSTPEQQTTVCARLRQIALELRKSPAAGTEQVVWSAMRRFTSLLPAEQADSLLEFLERRGPVDTRMVALQCIARVFEKEPPSDGLDRDALMRRVAEYADKFLDPDIFAGGENSVIARNAVVALAALGSAKLEDCIERAEAIGKRWFTARLKGDLLRILEAWSVSGGDGEGTCAFRTLRECLARLGWAALNR
jgi:hypothetical protein